ncbi:hypothetical protein JCM6882_000060 [Rhodosporidiobolus microsporus]
MTSAPLDFLSKLRTGDIIPSILPEELTASLKGPVKIHFPEATASLGEEVERPKTLSQPEIEFPEADAGASYTLIMTDPDLFKHNDPVSGQVRHWLQSSVNFDATTKRTTTSLNPPVLNSYVPPSPAIGTGKHRYIFILAKEPAAYTPAVEKKNYPLQDPADLKDRLKWTAAEYIKEEGLTVEGVGWMEVAPDLASTKDNLVLTAEAIKNKVTGQ